MTFIETLRKDKPKAHMLWCVAGIIGSLMLYGVLQERIMTRPYGGEHWNSSLFLVLCNRLTNLTVAYVCTILYRESTKPAAPILAYGSISLSNVVATFCQYEALKYVSFPVQTLAKTAKMIPVMIWGTIIMRKSYTFIDYAMAVAVTAGCTIFVITGDVSSGRHRSASIDLGLGSGTLGAILMVGYLAFDGFTSTFQDKLFKGYEMSMFNQILYVNLVSACMSLCGLILSNQLVSSFAFVTRHPEALASILVLSLSATVAQLFISHTIKSYGALLFATVMTTRQFLSILASSIIFAHPLSGGQWVGTVLVFSALYSKTMVKGGGGHHSKPRKEETAVEAIPAAKAAEGFKQTPRVSPENTFKHSLSSKALGLSPGPAPPTPAPPNPPHSHTLTPGGILWMNPPILPTLQEARPSAGSQLHLPEHQGSQTGGGGGGYPTHVPVPSTYQPGEEEVHHQPLSAITPIPHGPVDTKLSDLGMGFNGPPQHKGARSAAAGLASMGHGTAVSVAMQHATAPAIMGGTTGPNPAANRRPRPSLTDATPSSRAQLLRNRVSWGKRFRLWLRLTMTGCMDGNAISPVDYHLTVAAAGGTNGGSLHGRPPITGHHSSRALVPRTRYSAGYNGGSMLARTGDPITVAPTATTPPPHGANGQQSPRPRRGSPPNAPWAQQPRASTTSGVIGLSGRDRDSMNRRQDGVVLHASSVNGNGNGNGNVAAPQQIAVGVSSIDESDGDARVVSRSVESQLDGSGARNGNGNLIRGISKLFSRGRQVVRASAS